MADFLAINRGTLRMLDWLKRKAVPAPGEQLLASEDHKPLTDERLGRLLGRLGPDSRPPSEPAAEAVKNDSPPGSAGMTAEAPAAPALNEAKPSQRAATRPDERFILHD